MEAPDLVFDVDRAVRPGRPPIVGCVSDQLDLNAVKVLDQDRVGVETACSAVSTECIKGPITTTKASAS